MAMAPVDPLVPPMRLERGTQCIAATTGLVALSFSAKVATLVPGLAQCGRNALSAAL